jgi:hypothetical protein
MARHNGALGRVAIITPENWENAATAKRACYIAMARNVLGNASFKPWNHFAWEDFKLLKQLAHVFKTRHLPVSNAKAWENKNGKKLLPPPPEWSAPALQSSNKRGHQKSPELIDLSIITVWDSDEGCLTTLMEEKEIKRPSKHKVNRKRKGKAKPKVKGKGKAKRKVKGKGKGKDKPKVDPNSAHADTSMDTTPAPKPTKRSRQDKDKKNRNANEEGRSDRLTD